MRRSTQTSTTCRQSTTKGRRSNGRGSIVENCPRKRRNSTWPELCKCGLTHTHSVVRIRTMGSSRAAARALTAFLLLGHSLCWCPDIPSRNQKPSDHACLCCPASHQPGQPFGKESPPTDNCSRCPDFSICANDSPREPLRDNLEQVPAVVAFTVPLPCASLTLARALERRLEGYCSLSPEQQHISLLL